MTAKKYSHNKISSSTARSANRRKAPGKAAGSSASHVGKHSAQGSARASRRTKRAAHNLNQPTVTKRNFEEEKVQIPLPNGNKVLLTRRQLLYGAVGAGALLVAGGGAAVVTQLNKDDSGDFNFLEVPEEAVATSDDFAMLDDSSNNMVLVGNFELPYGTLVWANDDSVAACLLPTDTAKPLTQIALLFLGSGEYPVVRETAVSQDEGFDIYDVRANSSGLIWTEVDILDGVWRIYSATFDGNEVGQPTLLDEGTSDWETPTIAAVGSYAFWQVLPQADGPKSTEDSLLKRAPFGSSQDAAEVVYTSHGRMCTPPYALHDSVVITPRTETGGVRYQLTHIDAQSGEVLDTLVLPQSMKPLEAGYGNTGFMFSFDAIYNYGEGIANLGTYVPASEITPQPLMQTITNERGETEEVMGKPGNEEYSGAPWFRFARTPSAAPAWCGKYLMVKSTSAVCGIDFDTQQYFALEVKSGTDSYGDYLASTGMGETVVTYSNIDYQPLDGDAQKYCLVRVWSPIS